MQYCNSERDIENIENEIQLSLSISRYGFTYKSSPPPSTSTSGKAAGCRCESYQRSIVQEDGHRGNNVKVNQAHVLCHDRLSVEADKNTSNETHEADNLKINQSITILSILLKSTLWKTERQKIQING